MLPPLSDRTKSFGAIAAVLAIALCNVVFGTEWVSGPPPPRVAGTAVRSDIPKVVSAPAEAASPVPAAKAAIANTAPMPEPVAPQPIAPAAPASAETAQPQCDVVACAQAYRSFRESDCTWQPYDGPRRLCTKGAETSNKPGESDARADGDIPANAHCHYRSCAEAYSSFNPDDCTYQPLDGPRRLCTK